MWKESKLEKGRWVATLTVKVLEQTQGTVSAAICSSTVQGGTGEYRAHSSTSSSTVEMCTVAMEHLSP